MEAALPLLRGHRGKRRRSRRRRLGVVAEEFHVAAERNRGNLPARAVPVVEAHELRPEPEREGQHLHARPARDEEMAQLVKEDDNRQDKQEGDDVTHEPMAQRIETMQKNSGIRFPSTRAKGSAPNPLGCL